MKKLIFIDVCMRASSRTKRIASPIIAELCKTYSIETVDLTTNIYPVADNYTLEDRESLPACLKHKGMQRAFLYVRTARKGQGQQYRPD